MYFPSVYEQNQEIKNTNKNAAWPPMNRQAFEWNFFANQMAIIKYLEPWGRTKDNQHEEENLGIHFDPWDASTLSH